ncbi:hypothetical protein ABFS82_02G087400 [Erythranthe guttata]
MEGFGKVLLVLTVLLGALSVDINGGRILKGKDEIDHPQTFGSINGGTYPSPIFSGSFPSPGFGGFTGSFPSPNSGFGPSTFCSFPGIRRAPGQPVNLAGSSGGASVSINFLSIIRVLLYCWLV